MTAPSASRRLVVGGAVATAGIATIAAPVVTGAAAADPTDDAGDATSSPQVLPTPGLYESCTAYFGLTKGNSDLVSYDVQTEGPVSPAPVLGTNVVPVLTVQTSGGEVQCIPEAGWTDESTWVDWINWDLTDFTYPGTGYDLVPSPTAESFSTPDGAVTVSSTSIRFETDILGVTVSWTPAGPPATETGWFPFSGVTLTPTSNGVPQTLGAIEAAGNAAAAALAEQILVDETCDDEDPAVVDLAAALSVIFDEDFSASCGDVEFGTWILYRSTLLDLMVERSLVVVTLSAPTPTTSGAVAADGVVAPTFTG